MMYFRDLLNMLFPDLIETATLRSLLLSHGSSLCQYIGIIQVRGQAPKTAPYASPLSQTPLFVMWKCVIGQCASFLIIECSDDASPPSSHPLCGAKPPSTHGWITKSTHLTIHASKSLMDSSGALPITISWPLSSVFVLLFTTTFASSWVQMNTQYVCYLLGYVSLTQTSHQVCLSVPIVFTLQAFDTVMQPAFLCPPTCILPPFTRTYYPSHPPSQTAVFNS